MQDIFISFIFTFYNLIFLTPRGGSQGCGELIKLLTDYFFEMSVRQYVSVKNGRDQYSLKKLYLCRSCPDFLTNENCLCFEKYSAMHKLHIVWQSIMLGKKTTQHGRWVEIKALITTTKTLEVHQPNL